MSNDLMHGMRDYVYRLLLQGSLEADRLEFVLPEEIDSVLKQFE